MDATAPDFGPPRGEQELAAAEDIVCQAFAMPPEEGRVWRQKIEAGGAQLRVLRQGGPVAATLIHFSMGQWFGGRRIPLVGIAGVGVAPARRGQGSGVRLMQACLQELRGQGVPLVGLYPSTQPLYRRVGFEQAGSRFEIRVRLSGLDFQERSLSLRPVEASDLPALHDVYRRCAQRQQGWLDRGPYIWNRVTHPRGETAYGYLVEGPSGVEGYVYLSRRSLPQSIHQELSLTDLIALTPAAGRRLLSFIGDHRSLTDEVVWRGGPADPLLLLLREQTYQVKHLFHWMLRVLDVPAVLQARGYPAGYSGALHLEVEDELFPENRGRFVLEVENGVAEVRPGGDGDVKLHVRALAALFSGFLSPAALQFVGVLEADEASLRTAAALFSGPPPAMPDMF
ncbi:enhanced intracellular survival protein Eis [Vitiosangium sp. GDMCC 1.1324]|uniref:GNAT family N-acetyltransferase n=1 Tax=Vitiosangium sp. (strain GDMCC 1.1324) TaxID=2138576 RepID=UPI000D396BF0|nr:GNAT family N-acetyltransferase [Vitiosangium sp. GDMCC 1.1324]PTL83671.1 GNAT family N-acetyltransferase [Vitiosangium sp. GDMCC 1.1324]